ncbi:hypothetical protein K6119_01205 [Paracrocinitomix mangrovi]|uniref:hypothetical protein n=1 Tax=Paracrocinitomix mangrovi TaxID=2862509 RepID=UPI001C8ED1BD|nr:hypothetical protein [Paracrocinitomix mangrovi]UKN02133.1 hypothetical protein K6119_01205 [Paracrocinitomix mangrovi]
MKKNIIILSAMMMLVLSSCKVLTQTKTTPRTIDAQDSEIIIKPLLAEVQVDVNKKITGSATITGSGQNSVNDAKTLAKWNALQSSGADIIVDPVYKVIISGASITAEVTGFYGKYTKISTVADEELEKLELYTVPANGESGSSTSVVTKLKKLKK